MFVESCRFLDACIVFIQLQVDVRTGGYVVLTAPQEVRFPEQCVQSSERAAQLS